MFRAARPTATASVRFVARLVVLSCLAPGIADAAWDRNGVPLATGDTDQSNPLFLPDAHGAGHVVWLEPFTSRIFHRYVSTLSGFSF
jgi:hypothetical protein